MDTHVNEVVDNQYISHLEYFNITHNGTRLTIRFAHKRHGEAIEPALYLKEFYAFYSRMSLFIKDGDTVLDFGAYDGDTSLPLAVCAGSGKCIAFEPSLIYTYGLQINCGLNPDLNIDTYNLAASNSNAVIQFNYDPKAEVGGHPLNTERIGTYTRKVFVRTVDIAKFIEKESKISFIKSDTEGFDMEIIKLLHNRIKTDRPVILIEWFHNTSKDILQFLKDFNYEVIAFNSMQRHKSLPVEWEQDLFLVPCETKT